MEVFQTDKFYIFVRKETSLWWNRSTSEFAVKSGWDLSAVDDIECLGLTPGIVGCCSLADVYQPHLVIVREAAPVGVLYPPHMVYKVRSVCILSADEPDGGALQPCPRHSKTIHHSTTPAHLQSSTASASASAASSATAATPTPTAPGKSRAIWGAVKSAGHTIKNTTANAAAAAIATSTQAIRTTSAAAGASSSSAAASASATSSASVSASADRIERRITDELHRIFDDTDSFYYSPDADITNNLQRRNATDGTAQPDERFFWNQHMLAAILQLPNAAAWSLPIMQGFVQIENCVVADECFTLALVSRRSRHRAGTRYKRRGVDAAGHCANYVETEQILTFRRHQMAFTQVRGSVPVFWSQPGFKYRPPPRLDAPVAETQAAFARHFAGELELYRSVYIVNLVEQGGKERVIFDAYGDHVCRLNDERLIYVTFDFHDYCRGMRFENVAALIEAVAPEASAMGFTWSDARGLICQQRSVFRVNCMDCLDRTNVVQTAFGKAVLESQLVKLGLAPPYSAIPDGLKGAFMMLWANNGDVLSRQYAGTNALKGDYTRTGERKLAGLVKDGMNSANRYYIQHFDDSLRQAVIDLQLGLAAPARRSFARLSSPGQSLATIFEVCRTICEPLSFVRPPLAITSGRPGSVSFQAIGSRSLRLYSSSEMWLTQNVLQMTSYYLARFKDAYRQATIDLQLGNPISPESLAALGGSSSAVAAASQQSAATAIPAAVATASGADETDALEGAEHARLLVEDCRRMLLGAAQYPIGAWGLIDAAPATGDANETEVDTILLLTDELYLMAEYDSHLDKIVRFEKVALSAITSIEFGLLAPAGGAGTGQAQKMFQQATGVTAASASWPCLRLNYELAGEAGYYHMFRSPSIRFFNNMALVIRTQDEVVESLAAIAECFRVALDAAGSGAEAVPVPVQTVLGVLARKKGRAPQLEVPAMNKAEKKSKIVEEKGMPRNHSESQLLQLGSKALSNVAGQFSKFGQSLVNPGKSRKTATASQQLPQSQHPATSAATAATSATTSSPSHRAATATTAICYSPSTSSLEIACVADEDACVRFALGADDDSAGTGSPAPNSCGSAEAAAATGAAPAAGGLLAAGEYDSGDEASSAYEARFEENAFLPSVGIVMAKRAVAAAEAPGCGQEAAAAAAVAHGKRSADVCTMSISSVTEQVPVPGAMQLGCGSPVRAASPAPLIRISDGETGAGGGEEAGGAGASGSTLQRTQLSHSSVEMRSTGGEGGGGGGAAGAGSGGDLAAPGGGGLKSQSMHTDLSLNLSGSQSESAINKQLKTLTSPLSKLATGMKSFGMNLDPRKMNLKSPLGGPGATEIAELPPSRSELTNQRLQEQWDTAKCKTKLIAL